VPLDSSPLGGFDALLATVQMPPGVPVAAVGVGAMGAKNAAHLAVSILALQDEALRIRLQQRRRKMAEEIVGKAATLRGRLRKILEGK
jgi:phosphoribosylamine--glycine ligase